MPNLLKEIVSIKNAVIVLVLIGLAFGAVKFWENNGKNLTWCSTHSLECQIARVKNVEKVLNEATK